MTIRLEVAPTQGIAHSSPKCAAPKRRDLLQGDPLDRFEGSLEAARAWMLKHGWWPCGSCLRNRFSDVRDELRRRDNRP